MIICMYVYVCVYIYIYNVMLCYMIWSYNAIVCYTTLYVDYATLRCSVLTCQHITHNVYCLLL